MRRLESLIRSQPFILLLVAGFGLGLAACFDWTEPLPDPEVVAAVQVRMAGAGPVVSPELRAVYHRLAAIDAVDRPDEVRRSLDDPGLDPDDRETLRRAEWVFRMPDPRPSTLVR